MSRTYRRPRIQGTHDRKKCAMCKANLFERQLPLPFVEAEPEEFPLSVRCECMYDEQEFDE